MFLHLSVCTQGEVYTPQGRHTPTLGRHSPKMATAVDGILLECILFFAKEDTYLPGTRKNVRVKVMVNKETESFGRLRITFRYL